MSEEDGLICAYRLDGKGGAQELGWDDIADGGVFDSEKDIWVHLHLERQAAKDWIKNKSGLPPIVAEALLYEETRPRCDAVEDGVLINLRGVNLNPGSDAEDMVSVRIFADKNRLVSVRRRRLMAIQDVRDRLAAGTGPKQSGEFLIDVASQLLDRMGPVIASLDDAIDQQEVRIMEDSKASLRGELWQLRRKAVALRRYVSPQRDALARLAVEKLSWMEERDNQRLREVADRITRFVEDLDAGRERAAIAQDDLTMRLSERMNNNMYVLSVIAAIFLPLSLLTGLLGINVGGIPGTEWKWSFSIITISLFVAGYLEYLLFKKVGWI